ncbi:hypothetical protein H5410_050651 [Solanum commersonii]|uniref:Uncharacterized protein n=1 Tax=Solanum commersonii TaxID=4109 RepID=A0A9J5WYJ6_SOLCO|nr:hypothetical protein H5410_050651 [Solanum commersonii]
MQISINSYHLQGITKSAQRFVPIPFAPDGLTEEFYDLDAYNPAERTTDNNLWTLKSKYVQKVEELMVPVKAVTPLELNDRL